MDTQKNQQTIEFKVKKDMKQFTQVNNSKGLISLFLGLKSRITSTKPLLTMLALLMVCLFGVNEEAWGSYDRSYYAGVGVKGGGSAKVEMKWKYIIEGSTGTATSTGGVESVSTSQSKGLKSSLVSYKCIYTVESVNDGYSFAGWYNNSNCSGNASNTSSEWTAQGWTTDSWSYTFYAYFAPVTVSSAKSSTISFNCPATKTTTLTFPVSSNADAAADFNAPTVTANSGWSITEWSFNNSTKKVTVTLSFTADSNTSKGDHPATVTLKAKSNEFNTGTVTASVDLTPILTYKPGAVDISVSDADKTIINVDTLRTAYKGADNVAGDGAITYSLKTANSNVSLTSAGVFYAKATGTYTIVASATKGRYYAKTAEFTVTVGKRTPTVVFAMTGKDDHIYSGNTLDNMAKVQYNDTDVSSKQVGFWYWFDNPSWFSKNSNDTMQIMVSTEYSQKTKATLHVTTKETSYYKSVTASHEYDLEVKRTPEFYLNGVLLDKNVTTNLNLEVDETATFTFDKITTGFEYPTQPSHFTYNSTTGVLTATVAGDETFFFNEPGDGITFQHQCNLHLYVSKHETELELSSLVDDNAVWMVDDSVAESSIYELVKGDTNVPVVISSDKPGVIAKENGKWVAKGKGSAVLTIAQVNSDKWTGDTITRTINVNRYTPTFDWSGLPDTLNFNTTFVNPVRSTSDGAITYKSNHSAVTVTNDGTTLHTAETADNAVTITVIQKPTYKYEGKTATKTVKVLKLRNHVQVEVKSNETYLAVRKKTEGDVAWVGGSDNAIRLGGSSTDITKAPAWDWYDKYIDVKFEGVPKTISFTTGVTSGAATANVTTFFGKGAGNNNGFWYMIEYPEGESERTIWTDVEKNDPGDISRYLKPNTNKVRICYTGNFAGYVKNLKITERTELSIDNNVESLDFGSTDAGSNATKKNFTFDWYNLNPLTLSIEGGDGKYSVSPSSIASSKDSYGENVPVTVSYIHTAGGTHNATLVISEGTTELKRIPLTGTTNKVTPAITWKENLSPMSRGENVTDPAEAIVELVYTSSDSTVVDVEGNVLKPLKKGTATITASYDGSENLIYNSNSSSINVLVTNLAVQHIHWTQSFTRLKWSDDPVLSEKNTPDFDFDATVSYYDPETEQEVEITDRAISYTSGNEAVVKVLEGNKLHVVGQGNTTLTAYIAGITDSLYEATVIRDVIVREPTLDCEKWVLENKSASMETEINSYTGVEQVYDLSGEPGYLSFEAWREAIHVVIDWTGGNLFVAEWYNNEWHELTGTDGLALDLNYANRKAFDSIPLSREATQVKIYKKTGSTGIHAFSGAYVTLARYLELENTKNKKTHAIHLTAEEAKPGVAVEKTFTVNYSNITDQLDVELMHGDKFSIESGATIGNECGDKGTATVRVRFLSNDVNLYRDTLLVHNLTDTVYVYLSADVDKHQQQITWNPETTNLKTTDNVTFNATTSASAAGLQVRYYVTEGTAATVNEETGALSISTDGSVTIEARSEGNAKYYDAEPVPYTFHIAKVTPTITTAPSATGVTLPATLALSNLSGGLASTSGTFAWTNPSTTLAAGDVAYEVTFTPENTDWYNTTTCMVTPHVSKATQTIDWSFNATEMYGNADYTFDATASSGLAVTYSSSKESVASVNDQNKLVLHKAGESVTITATQAGNETYLPVSESRTFTVLRWTPSIEEYPVGGTMYVGRILSDASLDGGRAEVGGQKVEGSFVWENANSATIDVPGPATHNVIFVPQNGNFYNEVNCGPIGLTVLKYMPVITSNTLNADGIEFPQTLENSELHGSVFMRDYVHIPNVAVDGHVEWKAPSTILRPGMQTATALFVPDNTTWYENVEIPVSVQVTGGYVFNGDNTNWTEAHNWAGNLIPTGTNDPVLINQNVEITSSVTVGSLTIAANADVVVKNGAVLTVGNENSETRTTYGNLHVENGGKVILGSGELKVNDFTLDAQLGNITTSSASGQVTGAEKLDVNGDAYFQLALDPSGSNTYGWYDFVVPFEVDVIGGISIAEDPTAQMKFNVNYAVMDYTEAKRAVNGKDWNKFSGTMIPGRVYTITLDETKPWNSVVFKKKKGSAVVGSNDYTTEYSGLGADNKDNGWNGFGNGTLHHTELDVPEGTIIQLYDHANKCYRSRNAKDQTIAVGLSFFMQVPSVQTITFADAVGNSSFLAPSRAHNDSEKFRLALTEEDSEKATDYLWVSANEDATGEYVIGRDVLKMGTMSSSKVARVWSVRNGMNLCSNEMTMVNTTAQCDINLYAPSSQYYTLSVENGPQDATLYLTYNDNIIWDLTSSPYVFDLSKGTTTGYGLRIEARGPQIATGVDGANAEGQAMRKVIIDNKVYIITPEGKMYDIVGKSVKY